MAKLTRDDIVQLAQLARLQLSESEISKLQSELGSILGYVEQLNDVDVSGLMPTSQVTGLTNVMRADEPVDYTVDHEVMTRQLPAKHDAYIQVKRMVS